jgi:hypothetical protein
MLPSQIHERLTCHAVPGQAKPSHAKACNQDTSARPVLPVLLRPISEHARTELRPALALQP